MTYFLLFPYLFFPLGLAGLLRRTGWESWSLIAVAALGLGPMAAAWVVECYFWLSPGVGQAAWAGGVMAVIAAGLVFAGREGLRQFPFPGGEAAVLWLAFIGAGILYWAWSGDQALLSADTLGDRALASRIFAEGTVDARALVLSPTVNEVSLVHALHGLRHLILIGFTHAFGGVDAAAYDLMPHIFYLVLSIAAVGALVGGDEGMRSPLAWVAMLALACASGFAAEAMAAQMMSMIAFFGALVLYLSMRLFDRLVRGQTILGDLVILGFCLGTIANLHRLGIVFALLPVGALASCWSASDRLPRFRHLALAVLAFGIAFSPYGIDNLANVGGLSTANPMSPALVAYRAPWREAFEPAPLVLAWQQFWSVDLGWWLWGGFLVTSILVFARVAFGAGSSSAEMRKLLGMALVLWLALAVLADLTLLLKAVGQELPLRSTRYRIALLPCLAVFSALAVKALAGPRWHVPVSRPMAAYVGAGLLLLLLGALLPTYPRNPATDYGHLVPESLSRLRASDEERLRTRHFPELDRLEALVNQNDPRGGYLLNGIRPLIRQFKTPMRDPWYFPGAYPLLPCKTPAEAWAAAADARITRFLPDPGNYSNPITSATGVRHLIALEATELVQAGRYQLLSLRDKVLPTTAIVESDFLSLATRSSPDHLVFDVVQPGEYELAVTFSSKVPLRMQAFLSGGVEIRAAVLSFRPLTSGPQRLRFRVPENQSARVELEGGAIPDIESALLRRLSLGL